MLNYHELTMNEPRDSPARRKQFLVISAIIVGMTVHAGLSAGLLVPLEIEGGTFPGGEFVYKFMVKDYAASTGALRTVASDLNIVEEGASSNLIIAEEEGLQLDTADLFYSVLLDDPGLVPGGQTRFASGALLTSSKTSALSRADGAEVKRRLLDANERIEEKEDANRHSKNVRYEVGSVPKVNAAVAQHPFTAGAWSAVLQSYKIVPKFKQYAKDHGEAGKSPVVIATCSAKQKMCTYYMPLAKRDKFYLGRPTTEVYAEGFDGATTLQRMGVDFGDDGLTIAGINFGNVARGIKRAFGMGGPAKGGAGDEL